LIQEGPCTGIGLCGGLPAEKETLDMVRHRSLWIAAFVTPCLILFAVIYAIPLVTIFVTSFTKYNAFHPPVFSGLDNLKFLFVNNSDFRDAIVNTFAWILLQITVNVGLGTLVALILYRKPRGWKIVRAAYMIPNIIPTAAIGFMFFLLYNPDAGILKTIWGLFGKADDVPNIFGNSSYSFIGLTSTWLFYAAFFAVIIMAEIGAIPKHIFESAKLDGANAFQVDFRITLPMIRNAMATCVILATTGMISQFDIIYMTTKGGPGASTLNLPVYLFKTANLEMNYGLANTIGLVQVVMGVALVFLLGKAMRLGQSNE
jgi:raffinose/stachyose/melibiose transport system permease protein